LKKSATKAKKRKSKKQISKIKKTQKQNKNGKKGEKQRKVKKGEKMRIKMDLSICIHFAFSICFFFAFILLLLLFFSRQKANKKQKKQKKTNRESKINAKKMQMDKSICFPFFSLVDVPFFPHFFLFPFVSVLKCCFLIFHVFSFFCGFFKFKIIRISYRGEHKTKENHRFQWEKPL